MFGGYASIAQGKWDERKTFEYRYPIKSQTGLFGCLARFRQGFFSYGFTVDDPSSFSELDLSDWVSPSGFLEVPKIRRKKL